MKLPMFILLAVLFLPNNIAEYLCSKDWYTDYDIPDADCIMPVNNVNKTERRKKTPLYIAEHPSTDDYFHAFHWNTLYCCFLSQPYCPKIRWFKNGEELNSTYRGVQNFKMENGDSVLKVKAYHDSGGNYTCRATTPYDEVENYTVKIEVTYPCKSSFHVKHIPEATNAIEVLRGTNQTLKCEYYCSGNPKQWALNTWRNGKNELIRGPNFIESLKRRKRGDNVNGPDIEHTLTVVNFTKSENISCIVAQNPGDEIKSLKHTFHLVLTECHGTPEMKQTPTGLDNIRVTEGSNVTLKCQIFCLEKEHFGNFTWMFGSGVYVPDNNMKYKIMEREVRLDEFAYGRVRLNYEISLTIVNISENEIFTCNHSTLNVEGAMVDLSRTFRLVVDQVYAIQTFDTPEESFFKRTGQWIIIGILLVMLVILSMLVFWFRRRIKRWFPIFGHGLINKPDPNARYDAFISYNEDGGGSFVRSTLVPMLEEQCGYSLSLHYREFVPGEPIVDNIVKFLNASRKILMVVTPEFLKSQWCMFEVHQGLHRAVFKPNTLVVIMLNEIPHSELPVSLVRFLNKTTYLVWDENKLDKMCSDLKRTLGSPLKVKNQSNHGIPEESFGRQNDLSI